MSITTQDAEQIARLARLALDPAELERITTQLNSILEHMRELREVDIADIEPFASAAENVAAPSPDESGTDALQLPLAALTPYWEDGFFTVPKLAAQRTDMPEVG